MKTRLLLMLSCVATLTTTGNGLPSTPPAIAPPLSTRSVTAADLTKPEQPDSVSVTYTFHKPSVERVGEYDKVTSPGLQSHGEPGAPVLPFRTAKILLPAGTAFDDIEVIAGDKNVLGKSYRVEPGQELIPADVAPQDTPPDPEIYDSTTLFPGELVSVVSVQKLTGYTILFLNLYPVQYAPQAGELSYYRSLTVNVSTNRPARLGATTRMLRAIPRDVRRVQEMVDNPQVIETYAGSLTPDRLASPQTSLVDAGDPCDYIIITNETLSGTFQSLVDWKISEGLTARAFTTEAIYANYNGSDNQEKIRNFIVDAYTTWTATNHPLQYVVLGGDDEVIPARYVHVTSGSYATDMPVDLYYGGLDGDWDDDGDGNYGEPAGSGTEGEEVDFFAEVYVGRMTVETITEATHIVSKTLSYEQNPTADYLDKALWLGRQLNDSPLTWGGDSKDRVSNLAPQYNVTTLYQRDGTYSSGNVIAQMNAGTHLVNFDGHGNQNCCPLNNSQVSGLTNDQYFLHYNLGCNTACFDWSSDEAVAEYYVFTEHGAFAYIGNTRYGWYSPGSTNGPGNQLDRLFFDYVVNTENHNIGQALQLAKEDYYPGHRWSILTLSLFGDPETPLVTELSVPVANISAPAGGSTIKYSVDVAGTATAGYASGATFDHYLAEYGAGNNPSSWTQIGVTSTVTVTDNLLVAWDTTPLTDGTYTLRLRVDDGAGKVSSDRAIVTTDNFYITAPTEGELVRGGDVLTITGSALGSDLQNYVLEYGQGSNPSSWTFIFSSTVPVTDGVLLAWDTSSIAEADDYTIRLTRNGAAHNDSEQVTVYIDPTWQAGWPQPVNYRIVAPSLAVGDLDGNGDLEIVATSSNGSYGSYIRVWRHDGAPVTGWSSKYLSGKWASAPTLADMDRDGDLEIVVGTYNGYSEQIYAWHHDGSAVSGWPQMAGDVVFASPSVADVDGDGSLEVVVGSLDEKVYVWRYDGAPMTGWPKDAGGKLYASPVLGDLDSNLNNGLEIVTARQGAIYAWHHDGITLAGWPITITGIVTASPALGDLDDDGDVEVVLAAGEQVYAWHHNGVTVTNWPQPVTGVVKSSPALGDLDGDGDLEIVVGADQVYAWHNDGTPVAGWPVTVTEHTNSSPVLGDITGDGNVEVVIGAGDEDEHIYAWRANGAPVTGWPRWVPAYEGSGDHFERLSSPLLTDLDQDGDVEVAIGAEGYVFVHDLPATYTVASLEWPVFQHDPQFTGWYTDSLPNMPPFVRDVEARPGYVAPGEVVTITARVTDEDGVASVTGEVESPDETVLDTLVFHDDGLHGDGIAGDDVYGITWTTTLTKQDYLVDITAVDTLSHAYTHDNIADFTTQDVPYVRYDAYTINRENLNSDGLANPGEFVEFSLTLENIGPLQSPDVTATLSTDDTYLWWYSSTPVSFGDIDANSSATSGDYDFFFQVSNSCPHSHTLTFDLDIEDSLGHTWSDSFDVAIVDTVGPELFWASAEPRYTPAGEPVTIAAGLQDSSGISSVQAIVESPDETTITTLTLYDDGEHGDWGAGDGNYGNIWTTDDAPRIYQVDFVAQDGLSNTSTYDNGTGFTTQAFTKTSPVLLFADGGGGATDAWRSYYTDALDDVGASYDVWDSYWYGALNPAILQLYTGGVLIWTVPTWGYVGYSQHQTNMTNYLDAGGKLFISGQNVGQYYGNNDFYADYLHASYSHNITDSLTLGGVSGDPIGDGLQLAISGGDGADNQSSPDGISPLTPATTTFTYTGNASANAGGIRVDTGMYKVVYFSFGFEAIDNAADRATVMYRILNWLLGGIPPRAHFTASPTSGAVPLTVVFTNTSTGDYTASSWNFGDSLTSTRESPTHTYTTVGAYTVTLTVDGVGVDHTESKSAYIVVQEKHRTYLPLVLRDLEASSQPKHE